jgi:hypothetical protein
MTNSRRARERMRVVAVSVVVLLSGCAMGPDAVLPTTPERSEILAGDYESLASCSYEVLEKTGEPGLKKADLPASKTTKIALDSAGVIYWELSFKEVDAKTTAVSFSPSRNMWGSDAGAAKRVWPAVQSCVAARPSVQPPKIQKRRLTPRTPPDAQ